MALKKLPVGETKASKRISMLLNTEALPFSNAMRHSVLALDQGLAKTGFAYYTSGHVTKHGCLFPAGKSSFSRAMSLEQELINLILDVKPALVLHEYGGGNSSRTALSGIAMILAENAVMRACHHCKQKIAKIHQNTVRKLVTDKTRLLGFKIAGVRENLRPIKNDVTHAVCDFFGKPEDYWFKDDHSDALALLMAMAKNEMAIEEVSLK